VADLARHRCTIEEMEEYEPHLENNTVVYAGVDYADILERAVGEADVIVWDGGNNDLPFYRPALHIVVADPLRLGNELTYHPGEANLRMANTVVINKVDAADLRAIETLRAHVRAASPDAVIVEAASPVTAANAAIITGRRVLVVEDGPTLTHGDMQFGAGSVLAGKFGAAELVDPRPLAVGSIAATYQAYPKIGRLLPAMGYSHAQVRELEATIARVPSDVVIVATPIDLSRLITIDRPVVRARYELQEIGKPDLTDALAGFLTRAAA
jgi:predicted GTPase